MFFFFTDENLVEQKSALNFSRVNFNLSPLKSYWQHSSNIITLEVPLQSTIMNKCYPYKDNTCIPR